jgi:hypothetical protein
MHIGARKDEEPSLDVDYSWRLHTIMEDDGT